MIGLVSYECAAEELAKSRLFDAFHRLGDREPLPLSKTTFRPNLMNFDNTHAKNENMMRRAEFLVDVIAQWLGIESPDHAGFFPGFQERGFSGRVAGIDESFREDPAPAASRCHHGYVPTRRHPRVAGQQCAGVFE